MTTTFNARRAADTLCRELDRMMVANNDLGYSRSGSGLSNSQYVEIGRANDPEIKIRFSTHGARPTYEAMNGAAHCEIGTHQMASGTDWKRALGLICYRYDLRPSNRYLTFVNEYIAAATARKAQKELEQSPEYQAKIKAERDAYYVSPEYKAKLAADEAERGRAILIERVARELCAADGRDWNKTKSAGTQRRAKYRALAQLKIDSENAETAPTPAN
jgi:hypothetical protein